MKESAEKTARFDIDPRDYRKDRGYIGCLIVWGLLVLIFTVGSFQSQFWSGAIFGCLMLLLVIAFAVSQRNKTDTLLVSSEGLTILKDNRKATGTFIRRNRSLELTLEHVESPGEPAVESVSTLNLWDVESGSRHILGLWVAEDSKVELFERLRDFLESNSFEVRSRNEISRKANTDKDGDPSA